MFRALCSTFNVQHIVLMSWCVAERASEAANRCHHPPTSGWCVCLLFLSSAAEQNPGGGAWLGRGGQRASRPRARARGNYYSSYRCRMGRRRIAWSRQWWSADTGASEAALRQYDRHHCGRAYGAPRGRLLLLLAARS